MATISYQQSRGQSSILRRGGSESLLHPGWLVLAIPTILHVLLIWIVRPLPLTYATPMIFGVTILLVKVSKRLAIYQAQKLAGEFCILFSIVVLACLSIFNSNAPVRSFRVIFPALMPFLIFGHYLAISAVSKEKPLLIPRLLVIGAFILSTGPTLASLALPPVKSYIIETYRVQCFFENAIQHTIVLATVFPILAAELAISRRASRQIILGVLTLLYLYTMFRAGGKMAMTTSVFLSTVMVVVLRLRAQSYTKTLMMFGAIIAAALFLIQFGLPIAERVAPPIAEKIHSLIQNRTSYHSLQSRQLLWDEAIRQGNRHWAIGTGAGEKVLGVSHSHNLILDYYKGTGLFGAAAIAALCLAIFLRASLKGVQILRGISGTKDQRIFACYVGAVVYVIANQMSDCFGPSTIGFLWTVYLAGVLSDDRIEPTRNRIPPR